MLFAYNWPKGTDRYRRIQKFVDTFFPKLAEFQKPPRHPKWKEANLAATLPGWKRFAGAEEWLKNKAAQQPGVAERDQFDRFLQGRAQAGAPMPNGPRGAVQRIHAVEQDAPLTNGKSPGSPNNDRR